MLYLQRTGGFGVQRSIRCQTGYSISDYLPKRREILSQDGANRERKVVYHSTMCQGAVQAKLRGLLQDSRQGIAACVHLQGHRRRTVQQRTPTQVIGTRFTRVAHFVRSLLIRVTMQQPFSYRMNEIVSLVY